MQEAARRIRILLDTKNHDLYEIEVDGVKRTELGVLVWHRDGDYFVIDATLHDVDNPHLYY